MQQRVYVRFFSLSFYFCSQPSLLQMCVLVNLLVLLYPDGYALYRCRRSFFSVGLSLPSILLLLILLVVDCRRRRCCSCFESLSLVIDANSFSYISYKKLCNSPLLLSLNTPLVSTESSLFCKGVIISSSVTDGESGSQQTPAPSVLSSLVLL